MSIPKWLQDKTDSINPLSSEKELDELLDYFLYQCLEIRFLTDKTVEDYFVQLQKFLIFNNKIISQNLISELKETSKNFAENDMGLIQKFMKLNSWEKFQFQKDVLSRPVEKSEALKLIGETNLFTSFWIVSRSKLIEKLFTPSFKEGIKKKAKISLENHLENPLIIIEPQQLLNKVLTFLFSDDYNYIMPALLLASGRRPATFYLHSKDFISNSDDDSDYSCLFVEKLKRNGYGLKKLQLLCPFPVFKKALDVFDSKIKEKNKFWKNAKEANSSRAHTDSKTIFKIMGPGFTPRTLRALYAAYAHSIYGEIIQKNIYIKENLRHSNLTTSLNYSNIILLSDTKILQWIPKIS